MEKNLLDCSLNVFSSCFSAVNTRGTFLRNIRSFGGKCVGAADESREQEDLQGTGVHHAKLISSTGMYSEHVMNRV